MFTIITHSCCCSSKDSVRGAPVFQRGGAQHVAVALDILVGCLLIYLAANVSTVSLAVPLAVGGGFCFFPLGVLTTIEILSCKEKVGDKDLYVNFTKCSCCSSRAQVD